MDTYFAAAKRADEKEISAEIEIVSANPVLSGLLHSISGLLAVVNEHRQIVAVNDSFLKMLGIDDAAQTLGLRPGEALQCVHASEEPGGCGTSRFCSTCGAAIAIVSSLAGEKPAERICALQANKKGWTADIALLVRAQPIKIHGKKFLLLFLQDITLQQQRAALERTFFHDVSNLLTGLVEASEMLFLDNSQSDLVRVVHRSSLRLKKEVDMQRCLMQDGDCTYLPYWHETDSDRIIEELRSFFANHPAATNKNLHFEEFSPVLPVKTDMSLLARILSNMIINALEATEQDGNVRVWLEKRENFLAFCVWNRETIAEDIGRRIFQRNFSTKEEAGRGVGTYSMKLFGEQILGGKVDFISSAEAGTVFKFYLPI
ncbi:MAG: histidine kinase [Desulfobulbaceae bacterium DB1]|nr:MAG: histidine kinase [Desulfobulbaceae bacterium DB1]